MKVKVCILAVLISVGFIGSASASDFDPDEWKGSDCMSDRYRVDALDSFLDKYNITGYSESQLINLLGYPSQTADLKDYDIKYCVGKPFAEDYNKYQWIVIKLGDDFKVKTYEVITN